MAYYLFSVQNLDSVRTCQVSYIGVVLALLCLALTLYLRRHVPATDLTPPGPSKLPILGNIHQIPQKNIWKVYQSWHQSFGPLIYTQFGQLAVISIGSFKVAKDLLNKRSSIYSSRPQFSAANRINQGLHTALLPYGDRLRVHQALLTAILCPRIVQDYQYLQDIESCQLLHELLCPSPSKVGFQALAHRYTYSVTLTLAYGRRLATSSEDLIRRINHLGTSVAENIHKPTSLMVDVIPALKWLPRMLATWRVEGDHLFAESLDLFEELLHYGILQRSWNWAKATTRLNDERRYHLSRRELAFMLGSLLEASDTTDKVLEFFVMACVLHKQAVHCAQKELESVVGPNRLPNFDDAPSLPYVNAFVQEVMRWRPITPLEMPHAVVQDDEYHGYHIPKGAMVLPNNWSMNFDPEVYDQPEDFRPERWLQDANLPLNAFGFGKRTCPGQHLGRRSLFIVASRILWAFDISEAVGADGNIRDIDPSDLLQSALTGPASLEASFIVRSPDRKRIIEDAFHSVDFDVHSTMRRVSLERL
jgi:cytochrome P450